MFNIKFITAVTVQYAISQHAYINEKLILRSSL